MNHNHSKINLIVQRTYSSMSLEDQKILAYLIGLIKPNQQLLKVRFSTTQYMRMLNLTRGGNNFNRIESQLKNLANDLFLLKKKNGKNTLFRCIQHINIDPCGKSNGDFVVCFNPKIKPYLLNSSSKFHINYNFSDIMLMRSKYSPQLFKIFKHYRSMQKIQELGLNYTLEELHYDLNLVCINKYTGDVIHNKSGQVKFKYSCYHDFRKRVLIPAIKEINQFTEFNVKLTPIHQGKRVVGVNVVMIHKNKEQLLKRNKRIFCITYNIPKSQWGNWHIDTVNGTFRKSNPYGSHKIKPSCLLKHKNDSKLSSRGKLTQSNNVLGKHKIPFKKVNIESNKLEYYSPWVKAYIWTTKKEWLRQRILYLKLQEIKDDKQQIIKKFKKK